MHWHPAEQEPETVRADRPGGLSAMCRRCGARIVRARSGTWIHPYR